MKLLTRSIAFLLCAGGAIRILASQRLFEMFGIGALWPEEPYGLYIYRCLGGFVLFAGIVLFAACGDPRRYAPVLRGFSVGFLLIGIVMAASGIDVGLPLGVYVLDFLFCFFVSAVLFIAARETRNAGNLTG